MYDLSKESYVNFEILKNYHNAMLSINETNDYSDLYQIIKNNRDVEDFIDNYMLENDIYLSAELYSIVDSDLKRNGMKSDYLHLANKIENGFSTYLKINDYWNGIEMYDNAVEIFKEIYESNSDIINKYYFSGLELEPDFNMDEETDNKELNV